MMNTPGALSYDPYLAARDAYLLWFPGKSVGDWMAFKKSLKTNATEPEFFYQRLAELCADALEERDVHYDQVQPLSYALGYFEAITKVVADRKQQSRSS